MPGRQNRLHATSPHMRQRRHRGSWLGSPRCSSLQQDSCWPRLLSAPCVSSWPQTAGGVSAEPVSSICGSGEAEVGKSMACRRRAWLVAAAVPPGRGALPALSPSGCFTSFLTGFGAVPIAPKPPRKCTTSSPVLFLFPLQPPVGSACL